MPKPVHSFTPINDEIAEVKELYKKKLASSGITPEQAEALGMKPLLAKTSQELGYWKKSGRPAGALHIVFRSVDGQAGPPERGGMHRVRCLREPKASPKTSRKYLQPPKTGAVAYFPMVEDIKWPKVLADRARPWSSRRAS